MKNQQEPLIPCIYVKKKKKNTPTALVSYSPEKRGNERLNSLQLSLDQNLYNLINLLLTTASETGKGQLSPVSRNYLSILVPSYPKSTDRKTLFPRATRHLPDETNKSCQRKMDERVRSIRFTGSHSRTHSGKNKQTNGKYRPKNKNKI